MRIIAILSALLMVLAITSPAPAASVIFYSADDNAYGWCAGYNYGKSESCARDKCLGIGTRCALATECDGHWSAAAFANDPWLGFGASCEWPSANAARSIALLSCIYASHSLCWTSTAFDGSARATSEKSDASFDIAWYTQTLLLYLGHDIGEADGEIGKKTRSAVAEYQASIGVEANGETNWDLILKLIYSYGGTGQFVASVIAGTEAADQAVVSNYSYRYAGKPAPDRSLGAELAALPEPDRLSAVAVLINGAQQSCSLPALTAGAQDEAGSNWGVTCAEGSYLLTLDGRAQTVAIADAATFHPIPVSAPADCAANTDPDNRGPGMDFKPSPVTIGGMQPTDAPPATDCPPATDSTTEFKPSPVTLNAPQPQN
ncbi:MAG: peptidoglycan-binding domain-containing protein [Devosia sp.]